MLTAAFDETQKAEKTVKKTVEETTPQFLFRKLYAAACVLYGHVEKAAFRTYLIPLLFFKRISDVYDDRIRVKREGISKHFA